MRKYKHLGRFKLTNLVDPRRVELRVRAYKARPQNRRGQGPYVVGAQPSPTSMRALRHYRPFTLRIPYMVLHVRFERTTCRLEGGCSIPLS